MWLQFISPTFLLPTAERVSPAPKGASGFRLLQAKRELKHALADLDEARKDLKRHLKNEAERRQQGRVDAVHGSESETEDGMVRVS